MGKSSLKKIALIGNPNSGKSSLFNLLTGLRQKVGNYPGVTVDKKSGVIKLDNNESIELIDFPGIYSFYPNSSDEKIVIETLTDPNNANYPNAIIYNTAKNNPERVYEVANILGDLAPVNIAVQAFDKEVLKNIKRKNLTNNEILKFVKNHQKENRTVSTDIIVPNSGETLQSHLNTLKTFFEFGFDMGNINIMRMLPGTELESDLERNKYGLKTKWRHMDAGWGSYEGEFIFELDENVISSNSMKEEEMYYLKKIHFLMNLIWSQGVGKPLLKLAQLNNINPLDVITSIVKNKESLLSRKILNPLEKEFREEWFDTPDELIKYYQQPEINKKLLSGKEGLVKLNHKYLTQTILDKNIIFEVISLLQDYIKKISNFDEELISNVAKISTDILRLDFINDKLSKSGQYKISSKNFDYLIDAKIIPSNTKYNKNEFNLNYKFSKVRFSRMKNRLLKNNFYDKPQESLYSALTICSARFLFYIEDLSNQNKNINALENQKSALKKADEIRAS